MFIIVYFVFMKSPLRNESSPSCSCLIFLIISFFPFLIHVSQCFFPSPTLFESSSLSGWSRNLNYSLASMSSPRCNFPFFLLPTFFETSSAVRACNVTYPCLYTSSLNPVVLFHLDVFILLILFTPRPSLAPAFFPIFSFFWLLLFWFCSFCHVFFSPLTEQIQYTFIKCLQRIGQCWLLSLNFFPIKSLIKNNAAFIKNCIIFRLSKVQEYQYISSLLFFLIFCKLSELITKQMTGLTENTFTGAGLHGREG